MSPESWVSVCRIALLTGSISAAIAAFAMPYFQSQVDKAKDRKIDSLVTSNTRLERELLGQGTYPTALEPSGADVGIDPRTHFAFNGVRLGTPNKGQIVGEEFQVFSELKRLHKEGKSAQLIDLATRQIAKTPGWLTPYLYRGAAHAYLDDLEKSIADLRHVVQSAAGNSDYGRAAELLVDVERRVKSK
jgi:hypothetical protein